MPKTSWDEISKLQHAVKQLKDHQERYRKYVDGLLEMCEEFILRHEEEDD